MLPDKITLAPPLTQQHLLRPLQLLRPQQLLLRLQIQAVPQLPVCVATTGHDALTGTKGPGSAAADTDVGSR